MPRRIDPRRAEALHRARIEAAVRRHAPAIWQATRRLHAKWLRINLAAARGLYDRLVVTRAIHDWEPEVQAFLAMLEATGETIPVEELLTFPEVKSTLGRLSESAPIGAGFLKTDPRTPRLVADAQTILEDQVSAYWQTLTSPRLLAERLVGQKVDGVPYVEAARQISREYGTEFYRAERLVRSAYNSASNNANLQAILDAGFTKKQWLTSRDARVRRPTKGKGFDHAAAEGQVVPVDKPFIVSGEPLMFPGDSSKGASPGNVINCFPGDTSVEYVGLERAYRSWFEGDLVEATTAAGHVLAGTPNHPVMTREGWKALDLLRPGDELLRYGGLDTAPVSGDPDVEDGPTSLSEAFGAAQQTGQLERVRGGDVDFHGEGRTGEIEVVVPDGVLVSGFPPERLEHRLQLELQVAGRSAGALLASGDHHVVTSRQATAAPGSVGGLDEALPLLRAGGGHALVHGGAPVPDLYAGLEEARPDDGAGHAVPFGQRLLAHTGAVELEQLVHRQFGAALQDGPPAGDLDPGGAELPREPVPVELQLGGDCHDRVAGAVTLDRVVEVRRVRFAGHVYNLQTASGWYLAGGFFAHNCRCTVIGVD